MSNTKVSIVRLCKTPAGWRRYPVVFAKNGRIKANYVTVGEVERQFEVGRYQLRYYDGRNPIYKDVGDNASEAFQARIRQAHLMVAREAARQAGATIEGGDSKTTLSGKFDRFVGAAEARGATEAAEIYRNSVNSFLEITKKVFVEEVTQEDLLRYQSHLRKSGYSDRTISNRHANVRSFLLFCGLDVRVLAPPNFRPRYEKKIPEIYTQEEVRSLFAVVRDARLSLAFDLMLQCGLRDQEATYLEWMSVNMSGGILRVRANPNYKFKVKDFEQRDIPIPADLLEKIKTHRKNYPKDVLVCPDKNGKPSRHLLRRLKRVIRLNKLGCGVCDGCKRKKNPECERWFLHKFRATYITTLLRNGVDLRTVMSFSGHSDLKSVMRYLRPAESESVRGKIDAIQWK